MTVCETPQEIHTGVCFISVFLFARIQAQIIEATHVYVELDTRVLNDIQFILGNLSCSGREVVLCESCARVAMRMSPVRQGRSASGRLSRGTEWKNMVTHRYTCTYSRPRCPSARLTPAEILPCRPSCILLTKISGRPPNMFVGWWNDDVDPATIPKRKDTLHLNLASHGIERSVVVSVGKTKKQ